MRVRMGEKARLRTALSIIAFAGGAVVYSAVDKKFAVPSEIWGLATLAAGYLLSTAKKEKEGE